MIWGENPLFSETPIFNHGFILGFPDNTPPGWPQSSHHKRPLSAHLGVPSEPRKRKTGVPYFPWNIGCLIGIPMSWFMKSSPHKLGSTSIMYTLYTLNNQFFFIAQVRRTMFCESRGVPKPLKKSHCSSLYPSKMVWTKRLWGSLRAPKIGSLRASATNLPFGAGRLGRPQ